MRKVNPDPPTCGTRGCRFCVSVVKWQLVPRALSPADLEWEFGQAESDLGIRSTLGAFVDMALSGVQGGGKSNGTEARMVKATRLRHESGPDPIARHRCIHRRLAHVEPAHMAVLRAAYSGDDWTRALEDPQVRNPVRQTFGALVALAALTAEATAHAARRQAPHKPQGEATATHDEQGGVRCAYRPTAAPSRPKERGPRRRVPTAADAAARLFAADPAIAGSARGCVIAAACSADRTRADVIRRQAHALLRDALAAAGVQEPKPSRRVRAVQLSEAPIRNA